MELYRTVRNEAEAEQIIERSHFTAHVKPVESREEAEGFIDEIRSRYKDATHNVPAMVIGDKAQIQWASDDGEPQGTSGAPIVQMLVKQGITNTVIVVTRYFGGVKLGTGGLVRAYTGVAKKGLEAAGICSVWELHTIITKIDYTYLAKLQNMASADIETALNEAGFMIGDIQYTDKVTLEIMTVKEKLDSTIELLYNLTAGTAEVIGRKTTLKKV